MRESKKKEEKESRVRRFFSGLLAKGLKYPLMTVVISVISVGIGVALLETRDLQLLPNSDKMMLDVDIQIDNLFDYDRTKKAVDAVEEVIKEEENVEYYLCSVGERVPKYDFTTMASTDASNSGCFLVKLDSLGDMTKTQYCEYLENKLKTVTSAKVTVKEIGIVPKQGELIQFNVCGNDIQALNETALKASDIIREKGGVRDIYTDTKVKGYNYYVDMKNASLNSTGLTKGQVQNELNIAMMGRTVTQFRKNNKEYPVVLKTDTKNISDLKNIEIKSSILSGKYKLSQIADISYIPDYEKITHFNGERCVTVTAIPQGSKSPVALIKDSIDEIKALEGRGISIEIEGDYDMFAEVM
ncbi:MAG: efflux RND transporter permease subunit, partial [Firmicutes bacterium]|nr:efflux RND transporter permease subunit [Bacillota bacterium]